VNADGNTEIQGDDERERSRQLSLSSDSPPGEIEGYACVRSLGTGAYGSVWLAREEHTGRMVAIKFYPHRQGMNWATLSREVEKLAAVYTSRNIVRLLDVGWNATPPYFVMEYVENGSLAHRLASGPLTVEESVRIIREVCSALIDAHGAGVLHCDLKPDNVLLDGQMHARLCDFGQSRMSHEHSPALGTLYYMAPEQSDLEARPDAKWDVYAVGALLHHMLAGAPPLRNEVNQQRLESADSLDDRLKIYRSIVEEPGVAAGVPPITEFDRDLNNILNQCLAANPAQRLPNAQAVRDLLDRREQRRSRRPMLLVGVLGPLLLIGALLPIFFGALRDNLKETESRLIARALESDALSARLQAGALQDELEDRLEELENVLSDKQLSSSLQELMQQPASETSATMRRLHDAPIEERPEWMQNLDRALERADAASAKRNRIRDTSWFLTDAHGNQLWRREYSDETIGENFAWRDYFHGLNTEFDPESVPADIKPITDRHVSLAFRSKATGLFMVALSVPVRNEQGRVIGVFAKTAHLGDLQARLGRRFESTDTETIPRVIALADSREWRILDHPYLMQEGHADTRQDLTTILPELGIDADTVQRIADANRDNPSDEIRLTDYRDPVGELNDPGASHYRGEWMAAMAPVQGVQSPWMVIVQEHKAAALQPIDDMSRRATRQAAVGIAAAVALMAIIWAFVWRALSPPRSA
jgi:eukaryotic-like serine/threonine-protein kinase